VDTCLSPFLNHGTTAYGVMNLAAITNSTYTGSKQFYVSSGLSAELWADYYSSGVITGRAMSMLTPNSLPPGERQPVLGTLQLTNVQPAPLPPGEYNAGLWTLWDRAHPRGTAANFPLLPNAIVNGGWRFGFGVSDTSQPVFVDPLVAIGYDYFVDSGPNFASVLLPSVGDNLYDLWLWDNTASSWMDSGANLTGGSRYDFASGGISKFRILGIEPSAGLDPQDDMAFVTGLWFTSTGSVTMRQVPISFDTAIPAPGALALVPIGLAGLSFARRKLT
jgi:hypothetical protein